jgi:thioredoxin-dependent peroxiredoxin
MFIHMAFSPNITLKEGDEAPAFTAQSSGGGMVSLNEFLGRHVVLFFYPKDDTPGCTKEACAFRDEHAQFEEAEAVVLGVSCDSVAKHDKFISKFDLPFLLLSDEDQTIVNAYGSWGPKKFMGKEYEGIHRISFLIDPQGKIQKIWPKVKPEEHAAEVLAAIQG